VKRDDRWFFHRMRLNLKLIAPYDKGWKDVPIKKKKKMVGKLKAN